MPHLMSAAGVLWKPVKDLIEMIENMNLKIKI